MGLDGSLASGFSALIAGSSHVLICSWKILAIVSASSFSLSTPFRLYDTVMGAATVGKYSSAPPLNFGRSAALGSPSAAAKSTIWSARSWRPLPAPPPETLMVTADWTRLNPVATSCRYGSWKVEPDSFMVAAATGGVAVALPAPAPLVASVFVLLPPQAPKSTATAVTAAAAVMARLGTLLIFGTLSWE